MPMPRRITRGTCSELTAGGATILARGAGPSTDAAAHAAISSIRCWPRRRSAHALWRHEMFVPILMLHRVSDRDEAMRLANDTDLGLTAGFYGGADEVAWFQEHIEAGVTYANRPQGATTGAWPGYQSVRRLEGLEFDRQGDRVLLLPRPIPARAVAHGRGTARMTARPKCYRSRRPSRSTSSTAPASRSRASRT